MRAQKEKCYRCNCQMVYCHHIGREWFIKCMHCGLKTGTYNNYKDARKAWDLINGEKKCRNCEYVEIMRDSDGYIIGTDCKVERCKYE